ncbi:MAG: ABC transporter permease [Dehalococcoidales bacterium]
MVEIWNGFISAIELIVTLDGEVLQIAGRSLSLASTSTLLASIICLPLASLIHFKNFPGKRSLLNLIQTFYSVPTVVIGIFVFVFFRRIGPFGELGLLFSPAAIVIGQMILIIPILLGLTISALRGVNQDIIDTAKSLGASSLQTMFLILKEARFAVMAAVTMGFGRAISEVGISLMVGMNIRNFTRTITTAISLETSRGDIELSIALGMILLAIALIINIALNRIQQR